VPAGRAFRATFITGVAARRLDGWERCSQVRRRRGAYHRAFDHVVPLGPFDLSDLLDRTPSAVASSPQRASNTTAVRPRGQLAARQSHARKDKPGRRCARKRTRRNAQHFIAHWLDRRARSGGNLVLKESGGHEPHPGADAAEGEPSPGADVGGTERRTSGQSLWNGCMFPGGLISCHRQIPAHSPTQGNACTHARLCIDGPTRGQPKSIKPLRYASFPPPPHSAVSTLVPRLRSDPSIVCLHIRREGPRGSMLR
jgi:hypothetical protein